MPFLIFAGIFIAMSSLGGCLAFGPTYNVWRAEKAGEATYVQAEQDRRVKVLEAQAKRDSASLEAEAEVARAKGVAQANKIIADSLGGPEGYLRWRYISMLEDTGHKGRDVIYVPTEANLPILEAGKRP